MARKEPEVVRLSRGERLRDSKRQPTSMSLPLAVHRRLDLLAEAANYTEATRAEIVGLLIAQAALDPDWLESEVLRYRKLTVGEVLPEDPRPEESGMGEEPDAENVISFARRGPGRPGRSASS